jgi:hypothetical protein
MKATEEIPMDTVVTDNDKVTRTRKTRRTMVTKTMAELEVVENVVVGNNDNDGDNDNALKKKKKKKKIKSTADDDKDLNNRYEGFTHKLYSCELFQEIIH